MRGEARRAAPSVQGNEGASGRPPGARRDAPTRSGRQASAPGCRPPAARRPAEARQAEDRQQQVGGADRSGGARATHEVLEDVGADVEVRRADRLGLEKGVECASRRQRSVVLRDLRARRDVDERGRQHISPTPSCVRGGVTHADVAVRRVDEVGRVDAADRVVAARGVGGRDAIAVRGPARREVTGRSDAGSVGRAGRN